MNISFTPEAEADLDAIYDYIEQDNPVVAEQVIQRILQAIAILESFPLLGRPGRIERTREFLIPNLPYLAVYRIADETQIDVIAVIHMARLFPDV